jgi:hypothetical protein
VTISSSGSATQTQAPRASPSSGAPRRETQRPSRPQQGRWRRSPARPLHNRSPNRPHHPHRNPLRIVLRRNRIRDHPRRLWPCRRQPQPNRQTTPLAPQLIRSRGRRDSSRRPISSPGAIPAAAAARGIAGVDG